MSTDKPALVNEAWFIVLAEADRDILHILSIPQWERTSDQRRQLAGLLKLVDIIHEYKLAPKDAATWL